MGNKNASQPIPPVPGSGTAVPQQGTAIPQQGTAIPQQGTAVAPSGTAIPQQGTAIAPSGTAIPQQGTAIWNDQDNRQGGARPEYSSFDINGVTYTVVKLISDQSGEARMYHVTTGNPGEQNTGDNGFALKLYNIGRHPDHEVLQAIKNMPRGNGLVIDLYDFGVWTSPEGNRHDYELMPYIEGGSLASVRPLRFDKNGAQRLREIAIRMATEIAYCHERKVLHRDIKPANFLFSGNDINNFVLTDFGIGKMIGPDGKAEVDKGRTPIYAAPETYFVIPDRKNYATPAADFYAMGMTLLALWMGEGVLTADEEKLAKDKQRETLPYPQKKDIGEDMLKLIKALTHFLDENRPTFDIIERWANGEDVFKEEEPKKEFRIMFKTSDTEEVAKSPAELSSIMWNNQKWAKRFLYKDEVAEWFRGIERPDLAVQVNEITEDQYPGNQDAGLYACCRMLDPNMPYIGKDGRAIRETLDIADELTRHEAAYARELGDPDHLLWVYLRTTDDKELATKYPKIIKANGIRGVRELTYYIDPSLPFRIELDGKPCTANSVEELCDQICKIGAHHFVNEIDSGDFNTWLEGKDPGLHTDIEFAMLTAMDNIGDEGAKWVGLYTLGSDRGMDFIPLASSQLGSIEQIARCMAQEINNGEKDTGILTSMLDSGIFHYSILYYYLYTRGKYDKQIKWIEYCMDIYSEDNIHKSVPYTELMARMKAVAGLLNNTFPLEAGGKTVSTIQEYERNKQAINSACQSGYKAELLQDWLALQFQENPAANLSGGRYRQLAVNYLKSLMSNLPNCLPARQGLATQEAIDSARRGYHSAKGKIGAMKWIVILLGYLPLIAICGFIVYNLIFTVESESFRGMMESIGEIMGWIVGIGGGLALCAANPIAGIIGGIGLYYLTAWLIGLMTPLIPWILVAILVGIMIVFSGVVLDSSSTNLSDPYETDSDLDEAEQKAIMADAFDKRDQLLPNLPADYPACVYEQSAQNIRDTISARRWSVVIMIVISAAVTGITYWATGGNFFGTGPSSAVTTSNEYPNVAGEYVGQFDGREATMTLTQTYGSNSVNGTVVINYRNQMTHQVSGSFDAVNKELLRLYVLNADGTTSSKIYYVGNMGQFDSGIYEYSGTYYNEIKGSQRSFVFTQK